MEIQFQQEKQHTMKSNMSSISKGGKPKGRKRNKFVGVRQRPSGRWVAEIKDSTQNIRMWLGTYETAEEAARAYDEAARLLRGSAARTNFITTHLSSSLDSPVASRIRNLLNSKKSVAARRSSSSSNSSANNNSSNDESVENSSSSLSNSCETITQSTPTILSDDDNAYRPDLSSFGEKFDGFAEARELVEFDREVSGSLYPIHGFMDAFEVKDTNESIWDLPPLSSFFS
ncbi:hypothetical protein PIB30_026941 [Stylosanthes scabra]|uniref:AP2/ERF domain-containing protein n=1 Tax=Stylosanthes scabra TaxID=79078 RepID=A0ABU6Y9J1_9FABA|nr:hypothetical protein [Stylosanthes scabra]